MDRDTHWTQFDLSPLRTYLEEDMDTTQSRMGQFVDASLSTSDDENHPRSDDKKNHLTIFYDENTTSDGRNIPSTFERDVVSEMSGILPVSNNLESNNEQQSPRRVCMTDFAGQCAYYSTHQIFLSPRAFFLLVLDMTKDLTHVVGEEVCCQEGSIYKDWTFRGMVLSYMVRYSDVCLK
jgi:hypothetical protein